MRLNNDTFVPAQQEPENFQARRETVLSGQSWAAALQGLRCRLSAALRAQPCSQNACELRCLIMLAPSPQNTTYTIHKYHGSNVHEVAHNCIVSCSDFNDGLTGGSQLDTGGSTSPPTTMMLDTNDIVTITFGIVATALAAASLFQAYCIGRLQGTNEPSRRCVR